MTAESDDSEVISRGFGSSTQGTHRGIKDKCDHKDGMFGTRGTVCYCDEDLCNGTGTTVASAASILTAVAVALNSLMH